MCRPDGSSAKDVSRCEFELDTGLSLASSRILLVVALEDLSSVVWNWRLECEVMIDADDRMVSL